MNAKPTEPARVPLGQIVATPGALAQVPQPTLAHALDRHRRGDRGDRGDIPEDDRMENELSLREGFRLLSAYVSDTGVRFWIITEADRSSTCILLPEEY